MVLNFVDDRELANIYEFSGWALREIGLSQPMESVSLDDEVTDYRVPIPCDLFRLKQICYEGVPMTYENGTFNYLVCDTCVSEGVVSTAAYVRVPAVNTNVIADYTSDDGIQTVYQNQIVKVMSGHTDGGIVGHYYQRINRTITSTDLGGIDYTGIDWTDVSTRIDNADSGLVTSYVNPYTVKYKISPGWIRTSLEEGDVNLIYEAIPTDDEGLYKIPDDEHVLNALEYYSKRRLIGKGYKFPEENLEVCEAKWKYYVGMARSNATWPTMDQKDNWMKRWIRPLAILDRAQNFYRNEL